MQLLNAINIAIFYNYNVILPKSKYFNTTYICINDKTNVMQRLSFWGRKWGCFKNYNITNPDEFFNLENKIKNIDKKVFDLNKDETVEIIRNFFVIKNTPPLNINDLVIHIRSGDVFIKNPNGRYIMPPLSYYADIIDNNNFDEIYLIAEDTKNPCVNGLLKLYPKIRFKLQSLDEDIKLILGATNLAMSNGTMTSALLIFSTNIKNLYKASYSHKNRFLDKIKLFETELDEYEKYMTPWKNTPEQLNIMMTYKKSETKNI